MTLTDPATILDSNTYIELCFLQLMRKTCISILVFSEGMLHSMLVHYLMELIRPSPKSTIQKHKSKSEM